MTSTMSSLVITLATVVDRESSLKCRPFDEQCHLPGSVGRLVQYSALSA